MVERASKSQDFEANPPNLPSGPHAIEISTKFYYELFSTLNTYNVATILSATKYLKVIKREVLEVFSNLFQGWKDVLTILQFANIFLPCFNDPKIVGQCTYSISSKFLVDPPNIDWFFIYTRMKVNRTRMMIDQLQEMSRQQKVGENYGNYCEIITSSKRINCL